MRVRILLGGMVPMLALGILVINTFAKEVSFPETQIGQTLSAYEIAKTRFEKSTSSVLFTGDVMLSRGVEVIRERTDVGYYFAGLTDYFNTYDRLVINFEGSIPPQHKPTQSMEFRFSIPETYVAELRTAGVGYASLANNHSNDHGREGYNHTVASLEADDILPFGHSVSISTSSVAYVPFGDRVLALIGVNATYGPVDRKTLRRTFSDASLKSDIEVLYIHWGNEYEDTHTDEQIEIAKVAIDAGADIVIGHHPHVVQDIGWYADRPIVYSLGNLVFDQFFESRVQVGLLAGLRSTHNSLKLELEPVTSIGSKTQPRQMPLYERTKMLQSLADKSHEYLHDEILSGSIDLTHILASTK